MIPVSLILALLQKQKEEKTTTFLLKWERPQWEQTGLW
jgi:hypothetical protein